MWNRLPTKSNLTRRGVVLPISEANYKVCRCQVEDESHVFSLCPLARNVWVAVYRWLDFPLVIHCDPSVHFLSHIGIFKSKRGKLLATCIWECTAWVLWKARNKYIFNNEQANAERLVEEIKGRVWSWCFIKIFFRNSPDISSWWLNSRFSI